MFKALYSHVNNIIDKYLQIYNHILTITPEENKCCCKRVCVTSYELFQNIYIDMEALTVAIRAICDIRV